MEITFSNEQPDSVNNYSPNIKQREPLGISSIQRSTPLKLNDMFDI